MVIDCELRIVLCKTINVNSKVGKIVMVGYIKRIPVCHCK